MTKLTSPVTTIKNIRAQRAYNKMIKTSQAKLAETTLVTYSQVTA